MIKLSDLEVHQVLMYNNYYTVVGFLNASFSGVEQETSHIVPVGYLKGGVVAGRDMIFDVTNTPGTASEYNNNIIVIVNQNYQAAFTITQVYLILCSNKH